MRSPLWRKRGGFTLIELLVVIAIIAILIALLVPAVQKVREAASRTRCLNNLKQFGLAINGYEGTFKLYPPGRWKVGTVSHGTWVYLLPYVEQDNVGRMYDLGQDWASNANRVARESQVPFLYCPSTPNSPRVLDSYGGVSGASTDYAPLTAIHDNAITGGLVPPYSTTPGPPGILEKLTAGNVHGTVKVGQVTDGTSNTLMLVEAAGRPTLYRAAGVGPGTTPNSMWADFDTQIALHGASLDGVTLVGPCAINCTNQGEPFAFHSGGQNIVFGDGTVRFVSNGITMKTFGHLITRAGGEAVQVPW